MSASRKTISWFEWARALGALAIVLLHAVVSTTNAPDIAQANQGLLYAENLLAIPLTRWAVPVFLMITGALLLDPAREMTLERVGRYLWRITFVLLTVGFAFCLMETAATADAVLVSPSGAPDFAAVARLVLTSFLNLLSGDSWDHLWYLYALLGLYLMTPFISAFVRRASRREEFVACVALYVLLCVAPTVNALFETKIFTFLTVGAPVVYYLCGHYAYAYLDLDRRIVLAAVVALAALAAIYVADPSLGGPLALPEYGFALPLALAVFLALQALARHPPRRPPRRLSPRARQLRHLPLPPALRPRRAQGPRPCPAAACGPPARDRRLGRDRLRPHHTPAQAPPGLQGQALARRVASRSPTDRLARPRHPYTCPVIAFLFGERHVPYTGAII